MDLMTNIPTSDELNRAAEIIKKLPRGRLPEVLFHAISAKVVVPAIEICPVRVNSKGEVEFLLTQRPGDDIYWPSKWHIAGVVLLASDEPGSYKDAFRRILDGEFGGKLEFEGEPVFVSDHFFEDGRGRAFDRVYFLEVKNNDIDLEDATFFSSTRLPGELLEHYYDVLKEVERAYLDYRSK